MKNHGLLVALLLKHLGLIKTSEILHKTSGPLPFSFDNKDNHSFYASVHLVVFFSVPTDVFTEVNGPLPSMDNTSRLLMLRRP